MSHRQHFVPYATVCLWYLYAEQSISYFGQKLTFFFKFNKFQALKLFFKKVLFISQLGLKFTYVFQLITEVHFYKAVNMKSSLKIKAFSPDTEFIEQKQVIDKPIMINHSQIMLSKSENLIIFVNICFQYLLQQCFLQQWIFQLHVFTNCTHYFMNLNGCLIFIYSNPLAEL